MRRFPGTERLRGSSLTVDAGAQVTAAVLTCPRLRVRLSVPCGRDPAVYGSSRNDGVESRPSSTLRFALCVSHTSEEDDDTRRSVRRGVCRIARFGMWPTLRSAGDERVDSTGSSTIGDAGTEWLDCDSGSCGDVLTDEDDVAITSSALGGSKGLTTDLADSSIDPFRDMGIDMDVGADAASGTDMDKPEMGGVNVVDDEAGCPEDAFAVENDDGGFACSVMRLPRPNRKGVLPEPEKPAPAGRALVRGGDDTDTDDDDDDGSGGCDCDCDCDCVCV